VFTDDNDKSLLIELAIFIMAPSFENRAFVVKSAYLGV
jgi:hypothetical protein